MNNLYNTLIKVLVPVGVFCILVLPAIAQAQGFVPLTSIPAFKGFGEDTSIPAFLNAIYKICIGAAAVIAVIQITRAGVLWSTAGGSHSSIEQARDLIKNSIFGLVLVLSPVIVFTIIDPRILELKIDTSPLAPKQGSAISTPDGGTVTNEGVLDPDAPPTDQPLSSNYAYTGSYVGYGRFTTTAAAQDYVGRCSAQNWKGGLLSCTRRSTDENKSCTEQYAFCYKSPTKITMVVTRPDGWFNDEERPIKAHEGVYNAMKKECEAVKKTLDSVKSLSAATYFRMFFQRGEVECPAGELPADAPATTRMNCYDRDYVCSVE